MNFPVTTTLVSGNKTTMPPSSQPQAAEPKPDVRQYIKQKQQHVVAFSDRQTDRESDFLAEWLQSKQAAGQVIGKNDKFKTLIYRRNTEKGWW